jgi:hypothetical protein
MGELPPQPDEVTLEELLELARRLMAHPENRPGADKTWMLDRMRRFQSIVRAPRVRLDGPAGTPCNVPPGEPSSS